MKYLYLFLLFNYSIFAQNKYNIEYEYTDIDGHTSLSALIINNDEAVFKIFDDREAGISKDKYKGHVYYINNDELSTFMYSNNESSYTRTTYRKNEVIYTYPNDHLKWDITNNIKEVNNYKCNEALLTLHGRKYQVWFTTDIPVSYGPLSLNGLPGLIVEVTADNGFCYIKLNNIRKIKPEEEVFSFSKEYFKINKEKIKSYEEYEKLATEIMIRRKLKLLAKVAKYGNGASVTFDEDQNSFTRFLIDIPENAIKELQKIN